MFFRPLTPIRSPWQTLNVLIELMNLFASFANLGTKPVNLYQNNILYVSYGRLIGNQTEKTQRMTINNFIES